MFVKRKSIRKFGLVLPLLVALMMALPQSAWAATVSVTLDGASSVTVSPGESISAAVTVAFDDKAPKSWKVTGWQIFEGARTCVDTDDYDAPGTFTNSFDITAPTSPGTYVVTFYVYAGALGCADGLTPPTQATATLTVEEASNEPPVADPNGPYLAAVGAAITFDGSGSSDPDGDALTYAWDFGDGNLESGVSPTHSYAAAGIYDVCLTVNDGTVDSAEVCTLAVVYDPSAGFVTGGGWIDSQPGAYPEDPNLSGKATFGFVSKYKKGATEPEGNTQFQFQAGDLNFHSDTYEWLVVNQDGTNAQFKGSGTVNGGPDLHKFMIWANDGAPDTFRIKIWSESNGAEIVVYDNGIDQAIGGGSIVVHAK